MMQSFRFEPTYEELKQSFRGGFAWKGQSVLSLPMRNWNKIMKDFPKESVDVLSLPMRNWNSH